MKIWRSIWKSGWKFVNLLHNVSSQDGISTSIFHADGSGECDKENI